MRKTVLLGALLFTLFSAGAQQIYHKVKIQLSPQTYQLLNTLPVAADHGWRGKDFLITDLSEEELQILSQHQIPYQILIENVSEYYRQRNEQFVKSAQQSQVCGDNSKETFPTPQNWSLGSMGGFFTYEEFLAHLDTMSSKYPNLITVRDTIGNYLSHEGRPIYWLKISDNPNSNENEPQVLFTALHHSREPASLSQLIYFMYYLLENYGTNDEVTYLVDNLEMYFIPMVNPDGYVYNQTTDPNGGGMWRKNRRNNNDGTYGVDLNRNYGYHWGLDNNGSSPNTNSDTYRGPAPFSEPETQAVKYFTETHNFLMALNYHTYGNLLIYPWGYAPSTYTPDSAVFVNFAQVMTEQNHYTYGTGDQTVGYVTNGDSDDWMYGEQTTKNKILSFTPEAGSGTYGFWPPATVIEDLCQENIRQNLNFCQLALRYLRFQKNNLSSVNTLNFYYDYVVQRLGLDSTAVFTLTFSPITSNITAVTPSKTYTSLNHLESITDSVQITLNSNITPGEVFSFEVEINNQYYTRRDTITLTYGEGNIIVQDNFDNGNTSFTTSEWQLTQEDYYSPTYSMTDSPNGNYGNNTSVETQIQTITDLSGAVSAKAVFYAKWAIEAGYDYVQFLGSPDGGTTWFPLCGKYTKTGNSNQDEGQPVYDGFQTEWVREEVDLTDLLGSSNVLFKFRLISDVWATEDGFYFDDFQIQKTDLSTTDVSEISENTWRIFPNPARQIIRVEGNLQHASLEIFDATGRRTAKFSKIPATLDVSEWQPGLYLFKIVKPETVFLQKVIKQ